MSSRPSNPTVPCILSVGVAHVKCVGRTRTRRSATRRLAEPRSGIPGPVRGLNVTVPSVVSVRGSHCDSRSTRSASRERPHEQCMPVWAVNTRGRSMPRTRARSSLAAPSSATVPSPRMLPPYACRSMSSRCRTVAVDARGDATVPRADACHAHGHRIGDQRRATPRPIGHHVDARGDLALEPGVGYERAQEAHAGGHRHLRVADQWRGLLQLAGHLHEALTDHHLPRADVDGVRRVGQIDVEARIGRLLPAVPGSTDRDPRGGDGSSQPATASRGVRLEPVDLQHVRTVATLHAQRAAERHRSPRSVRGRSTAAGSAAQAWRQARARRRRGAP